MWQRYETKISKNIRHGSDGRWPAPSTESFFLYIAYVHQKRMKETIALSIKFSFKMSFWKQINSTFNKVVPAMGNYEHWNVNSSKAVLPWFWWQTFEFHHRNFRFTFLEFCQIFFFLHILEFNHGILGLHSQNFGRTSPEFWIYIHIPSSGFKTSKFWI